MRKDIDRRIEQLEKRSAVRFSGTPRLYTFPSPGAYVAWCADQGMKAELGSVGGSVAAGFMIIGPGPVQSPEWQGERVLLRGPWG